MQPPYLYEKVKRMIQRSSRQQESSTSFNSSSGACNPCEGRVWHPEGEIAFIYSSLVMESSATTAVAHPSATTSWGQQFQKQQLQQQLCFLSRVPRSAWPQIAPRTMVSATLGASGRRRQQRQPFIERARLLMAASPDEKVAVDHASPTPVKAPLLPLQGGVEAIAEAVSGPPGQDAATTTSSSARPGESFGSNCWK